MDNPEKKDVESDEELIKKYISEFGLDKDSLLGDKYTVSMSVNKDGIVEVKMEWPEDICEEMLENISHLLYAINTSGVKTLMVESLAESTISRPELDSAIKKVVASWLSFQEKYGNEPCVRPRDTLTDGV